MRLSVIIIDNDTPDALASCQYHLDRLGPKKGVEVVTLKSPPGESIQHARARAVTLARAEYTVFLNPRYRVTHQWGEAILEAHASGAAIVGGPVLAPEGTVGSARAIHLWEYVHTASPVSGTAISADEARMFPGGNTSYRTEILHRYDPSLYIDDMDFHSALADAGFTFFQSRDAAVIYEPPAAQKYLRELFRTSRAYAVSRRATRTGRLLQAVARAALLAPWLTWRNAARVWRKPLNRSALLHALPWFALFALIQTSGEVVGYSGPLHGDRKPQP